MAYTDRGYLDPIQIVWRAGTTEDPYVDRIEYLKVVNHKLVLSEIPDKFYRVRISGLTEVNVDKVTNKSLGDTEFSVDYSTGVVQVNAVQEAKTLNVMYKGKGFIQYPSERIYHRDSLNNVVQSLDEIINKSLDSVEFLKESIDGKISDYNTIKTELTDSIDDIRVAIDEATQSANATDVAREALSDAYNTTVLIFKPYVNAFNQITTTYPNPKVGWTTQVYQTGIRYRYDGATWQPIDLFGGNIAPATQTINGLMSKDDKKKLDEVSNDVNVKTMVFVMPNEPTDGVGHVYIRFPHDGDIVDVSGFCAIAGVNIDTKIGIEKSRDMVTWTSIMNPNITIKKTSHFNDNLHVVTTPTVVKDDIFRLNFIQSDGVISDITIQVKVKIK